ncbi:hypothetical protein [Bdellovibrio svalbardensis]|uniref:Uncharacterized protein n=1 Tax=Bdellovibrio svalbardensis TaxID=2972972 RepID=A0ABT6DMM5_9BACT|nr:hypothetical protein [Bdellovibrio svalbardensis]MDG0818053.1 hypothetical protein [Bdellovibrio svalbardensis]
MKHEMLQIQLYAELQKFGLNPCEWSLQPINDQASLNKSSLSYLIQNKIDKNFALSGRLKRKKQGFTWKSLELASL